TVSPHAQKPRNPVARSPQAHRHRTSGERPWCTLNLGTHRGFRPYLTPTARNAGHQEETWEIGDLPAVAAEGVLLPRAGHRWLTTDRGDRYRLAQTRSCHPRSMRHLEVLAHPPASERHRQPRQFS